MAFGSDLGPYLPSILVDPSDTFVFSQLDASLREGVEILLAPTLTEPPIGVASLYSVFWPEFVSPISVTPFADSSVGESSFDERNFEHAHPKTVRHTVTAINKRLFEFIPHYASSNSY